MKFLLEISLSHEYGFGGLVLTNTAQSTMGSPDPNAMGIYYNVGQKTIPPGGMPGIKYRRILKVKTNTVLKIYRSHDWH